MTAKAAIGTALALLFGCVVDPTGGDADGGASSSSSSSSSSGAAAGSSGLVAIDADTLCNRLITECGQQAQQADCITTFFPLRVTSACKSAIPTASCDDLKSTSSSISTLCFPACTAGSAPVCNGDGTITTCTATGNTHRNDCRDTCTSLGFSAWTGSCGKSYNNETSAQPQCWCR